MNAIKGDDDMRARVRVAIKNGLEKNGLRQKELAEKMGRTATSISEWINKKKLPNTLQFIKLVGILNIEADIFPWLKLEKEKLEKLEKENFFLRNFYSEILKNSKIDEYLMERIKNNY